MNPPRAYPRVPRLFGGSADDASVPENERASWLRDEAVVEEKLDGANVSIWRDDAGLLQVAGRAGPEAMDRARQLGRLRAWVAERTDALHELLGDERTLYGEWLWLEHSLRYERLPDYLVVLDLWSPEAGFAPVEERDQRATATSLAVPPRLYRGAIGSIHLLERLTRRAAFTASPAEGAVMRREHLDGRFDRCKWIREGFSPRPDEHWRRQRRYNQTAVDQTVAPAGSSDSTVQP